MFDSNIPTGQACSTSCAPAEPLIANLPQLVSHPAVLVCELAVPSGLFPEHLATTTAVFGRLFNCLCGSVLTLRGGGQAFGRGDQAGGCISLGRRGLPLRFLC